MKYFTCLLILAFSALINSCLHAQTLTPVVLASRANATISVTGNLKQGQTIPDLSWAWSSSNACFVSFNQDKFNGHHLLYRADLPRRAEMIVDLIPSDPKQNLSLYAYSGDGQSIVPDLPSCVSCEADFGAQAGSRTVSLRAVNNPYQVIIGVVGANGLSDASFELKITLHGGEEVVLQAQQDIPRFEIEGKPGETVTYEGDLSQGAVMNDLSWAWSSQNACFVSIRQDQFTGHHVLYATNLPKYSTLTIRLQPASKDDQMSLYAYSTGASWGHQFVPKLPSCVSCEADFQNPQSKSPTREVSLQAINNPYLVVIGVAGAKGLSKGRYTLSLELKNR
ncbi:MAG TPA: hypothetical protein PKA00_04155 [Saprospiraceae bacterium]|nr:hypothetical protein [Saprospiraceae bacterium]HMQ82072.1 hypothetical protein [Saprospiraceae bacterium]